MSKNIGFDIDAFNELVDEKIYEELCQLEAQRPLIETLYEFGIKGTKAVSFVMKFAQKSLEHQQEKEGDLN